MLGIKRVCQGCKKMANQQFLKLHQVLTGECCKEITKSKRIKVCVYLFIL